MTSKAQLLVDLFAAKYGEEPRELSRDEIKEVAKENGIPSLYRILNKNNVSRDGFYHFPPVAGPQSNTTAKSTRVPKLANLQKVTPIKRDAAAPDQTPVTLTALSTGFTENLIPSKSNRFVAFGHFSVLKQIVASKMFFPIFVTGLSGNGKTHMVEQACAATKREMIRVNFTAETDEDDLIGGFRLVNGETKFFKGPVISAMERGAVLLCDEIDLMNPAKGMCLQSIMEGSGYFIKKTGEFIAPQEGFTVIATANTKGKGSEDGQFIGTNILNEAFLERFPVTFEQDYPSNAIEKKILTKLFDSMGYGGDVADRDTFIVNLVNWATVIRKTYADDGIDEIISTRRLEHIVRSFFIFGDRLKSIEMCVNRFDDETKSAFLDLYSKVDGDVDMDSLLGSSGQNSDLPADQELAINPWD